MKIQNKIILEGLLLIGILFLSYYLYKIGVNMRHDIPIIKGEVADDVPSNSKSIKEKSFFDLDIKQMNEVATFTESIGNLKTSIEYPKNKLEMLDEFKDTNQAWKSDMGDYIYATNSDTDIKLEYSVTYKNANSIDIVNMSGLKNKVYSLLFDVYTFSGGAHSSSNMLVYNYDNNGNKIKSLSDFYYFLSSDKNNKRKDEDVYKTIRDIIRPQLISQLKSKYGEKKLSKAYLNWLDEGISYSATNTDNYNTWWIYNGVNSNATSSDKNLEVPLINIHIGQYQIAPYAYGEFDAVVPLNELMK